jgi:signal peptidase I
MSTAQGEDTKKKDNGKDSGPSSLVEFLLIVVVAVGLALGIQAFLVKPFRIPSESMVPTLSKGQRVLVSRVNYHLSEPDRGDIVVFKPPVGADTNPGNCGVPDFSPTEMDRPCPRSIEEKSKQNFIKRVVALPGDRLKVERGRVYIDGKLQEEPYIEREKTCENNLDSICNLSTEITIPPDQFFMMGDNRGYSADSRYWGPVPREQLIGQAFFTYWPPRRIGTL